MLLLKKIIFKLLKWIGISIGVLAIVTIIFVIYVRNVSDIENPTISNLSIENLQRDTLANDVYQIGNNWIRKNQWGLYEMYVEGAAYERGLINGKLSQELIVAQEEAFVKQIKHMIPSDKYLGFLKYVIGFVNRDLENHVSEEYINEIYGISKASSDSFNWIGSKYFRQLNYHAAHDIGHALQNMMLVGCSSLSAWNSATENGSMIIGRNFDFWVGDAFAEKKVVSFVRPQEGYPFGFVTWGAFIGVCSGMNNQGLTVTINAAKSSIPMGAATPVSLVAREILQYAKNIDEAIAIAHTRSMFVSESFLIGSAKDGKTIVIEKTPDTLAIYASDTNMITCTNHYQSNLFANQGLNIEQKNNSASIYRQLRIEEILKASAPLNVEKMASILRDVNGLGNQDIGMGNEKAINQLIAHHSIIFMPDSLQMWVSTTPWQFGTYVCYDLNKIFQDQPLDIRQEIATIHKNIAADSSMIQSERFKNFIAFRALKMEWMYTNQLKNPELLVQYNPNFYDAYRIAGDALNIQKKHHEAIIMYQNGLTKEIATEEERKAMIDKIDRIKAKQK